MILSEISDNSEIYSMCFRRLGHILYVHRYCTEKEDI